MAEPHIDPAIFSSDHISTENSKPPPKMISATTQPAVIKPVPKKTQKKEKEEKENVTEKTIPHTWTHEQKAELLEGIADCIAKGLKKC
jgi:hypothetical protein